MHISHDEANEIYARFLYARYGANAWTIANCTIATMTKEKDASGVLAWTGVCEQLGQLLAKARPDGSPPASSAAVTH